MSGCVETRPHRVLIVDDDVDGVEALKFVLEGRGYHVSVAHNGQEALDSIASDGPPCVVILDLLMPVMNGRAFLERRRLDPALSATPVVIVTATEGRIESPDDIVLRKPVNFDVLLRHIKAACAPPA